MIRPPALLVATAALASVAAAAQPVHPEYRAALTAEQSHLSNGSPDWKQLSLQVGRHWSQRQMLELELTETRRFGLDDTEAAIAGAMPLTDKLTASGRIATSPTHRVLARGSQALALQYEFQPAWLLHGAFKHTRYDATDVDQASVMLERYFGNWSALVAAHTTRAFHETAHGGEFRLAHYYGDASSIGLYLASGDEAGQVAPGTVAISRVRSAALVGQHRLSPRWSLRYGAHHVRQGRFYTRTGAHLGVQAAF